MRGWLLLGLVLCQASLELRVEAVTIVARGGPGIGTDQLVQEVAPRVGETAAFRNAQGGSGDRRRVPGVPLSGVPAGLPGLRAGALRCRPAGVHWECCPGAAAPRCGGRESGRKVRMPAGRNADEEEGAGAGIPWWLPGTVIRSRQRRKTGQLYPLSRPSAVGRAARRRPSRGVPCRTRPA